MSVSTKFVGPDGQTVRGIIHFSYKIFITSDIAKVFTTYQTFLYFCRNLNMFIKKKLKYFTRPEQISPDLSGVSGDFRIVCNLKQLLFCP